MMANQRNHGLLLPHTCSLLFPESLAFSLCHVSHPTVDNLMNLACSSVLCGGGTNVELMHHCLHENGGDVMVSSL